MANEFKIKKGLIVQGSGSTILDIQGSQGQLFSVTDNLSGSLFSVNDISGLPILEVFSDDSVKIGTFNAEAIKVSGSNANITGSLFGTSSWALNAVNALTSSNIQGGTVNYLPIWNTATSLSSSAIYQSAGNVGIGTTTPNAKLDVNGTLSNGINVTSSGIGSHAEGEGTLASGAHSHAEGYQTVSGYRTPFLDDSTDATGSIAITNGNYTSFFPATYPVRILADDFSLITTVTITSSSYNAGTNSTLVRMSSYTSSYVGFLVPLYSSNGSYSHAEGEYTVASGTYSHAEGTLTDASGIYSHAEGAGSTASGHDSHAEGIGTTAYGFGSHAEGHTTIASGSSSHAEGSRTLTLGQFSHAEGYHTVALGDYQHVQGTYNISSSNAGAFIHGNGTSDANRSNLIYASGSQVQITGSLGVRGNTIISGSLTSTGNINAPGAQIGGSGIGVVGIIQLQGGAGGNIGTLGVVASDEIGMFGSGGDEVVAAYVATTALYYYSNQTYQYNGFNGNHAFTGNTQITGSLYVTGALGVGTNTPTTPGLIRATNDIVAFYSSDNRLKENIIPIPNSLEKVLSLGGYEFDWIPKKGIHENEGHDIGVIAQEIEKVLPEIVITRENGYKAVKYEKIVPLLIEAIKEQQTQIEELKSLVQQLIKK
jgi:hypothetical protein